MKSTEKNGHDQFSQDVSADVFLLPRECFEFAMHLCLVACNPLSYVPDFSIPLEKEFPPPK